MPESSESRFVYTMRKASNLSALSLGEAHHRDIILTANARILHSAKELGFQNDPTKTDAVNRTRAAAHVVGHLVGVTGETYETVEGWTVDDALSRLVDLHSNPNDDGTDALRRFLELANEIRNRIEANPDEWWKDITQLSHQLEESRTLICPDKPWGFVLTSDTRVRESTADHIQTQSKEHPDLDCGTTSKDSAGFVLHYPSQPMTNDRKIAPDVLSMTSLWTCDPYADSGSVSVVETLCGPLGGELTGIRTPTEAGEALLPLDKWIRFAENKLGNRDGFARAQSTLRSFGNAAKLVSAVQEASADSWRETMAAIRSEADDAMRAELLPMLDELRKENARGLTELTERGFDTPQTVEQWERLARIVECPLDEIRNGSLTAAEIFEHAIAWADRKRIETTLNGDNAKRAAEVSTPASDDDLPKSKRADSPSRVKAKSAYEYAMDRIPDANAMTAPELFDAIMNDGEAAQMLPPNADTFRRYLNDCGIRLKKNAPKAAGGSVVRRSDL